MTTFYFLCYRCLFIFSSVNQRMNEAKRFHLSNIIPMWNIKIDIMASSEPEIVKSATANCSISISGVDYSFLYSGSSESMN